MNEGLGGIWVTFPGKRPTFIAANRFDRGTDYSDMSVCDVDSQGNVEIWPQLLEVAYAQVFGDGTFGSNIGGIAGTAFQNMTGLETTFESRGNSSRAAFADLIDGYLQSGRGVMLSTTSPPADLKPDFKPFPEFKCTHVYVVTACTDTRITMINPLGNVVRVDFESVENNGPYANTWFDHLVSGITVGPAR